jgi:serine/threonine-protein kinase
MARPRPLEDWVALSDLLDQALALPRDERARWIEHLSGVHRTLRQRLRDVLLETDAAEVSRFLRTLPKIDTTSDPISSDDEDAAPAPDTIGPYRVIRRIAQGGMGTVWLAHRTDIMVNRPVALKVPNRAWWHTSLSDRVVAEREILAALDHPNIARLYDAGVTGSGQSYLALEHVDGRPVDEYVRNTQLPIRDRLCLFVQIARAVAHAHARLVVHQDLKPSNILVTNDGDVKLLDFGIAELCDRDARATGGTASARPLTPAYASPEQLAGESLSVATDVYSSGVVLYELLTGERPSAHNCPRRPSDVGASPRDRRALRGDVDAIVLKALAHRPEDRYATMDALADDIERHLHRYPVAARADRASYRLGKFAIRHIGTVTAAALVVAAVLVGSGLAVWQRHVALEERTAAVEVRDFLTTLLQDASPYGAGGRALSAVDWLKEAKVRLDHRLNAGPSFRVELLNIIGSSLLTSQDTAAADAVLTQAVQEGVSRLGPHHRQTIRARVQMTAVHRFRGRAQAMRADLDQLLPVLRARKHELSEDLVVALRNRTHLDIDGGRYQAADAAAEEAVDVALTLLGDDHPETVAAVLTRAYAYQFSRPPDQILAAAQDAYRRASARYGRIAKHPRTIEGRFLLGRALGESGHTQAGVAQLSQAVQEAVDVFGPASRMVGLYSVSLAQYQLEIGEITEALENSRRAVDIVGQHAQPHSYRYAAALHRRGAALLAARRADEAVPDLTRAHETIERVLPPNHGIARGYRADLAIALARAGDPAAARRLLEPLVPNADRASDASARHLLYAMGVAARLSGDANGALGWQERTLATLPTGRRADLRRMLVLTEIGLAQLERGRPAPARAALEQALALARRSLTRVTPDQTEIVSGLERANAALGDTDPGPVRKGPALLESPRRY